MQHLFTIAILFMAFSSFGQPSEATVLRLLDSYEIIPGGHQSSASELYPGEGMEIDKGSYMQAGRNEFLLKVPLEKGPKISQIAFVGFQDEEGIWQRSTWFSLGFKNISSIDLEDDGLLELINEVELNGRNMIKSGYKLLSLEDNEESEIYSIEGFDLQESARSLARQGDHISSTYKITLADINEDGIKEITEEKFEEYFSFEDDNRNLVFNEPAQRALTNQEFSLSVYQLKKGEYVLMKDKE